MIYLACLLYRCTRPRIGRGIVRCVVRSIARFAHAAIVAVGLVRHFCSRFLVAGALSLSALALVLLLPLEHLLLQRALAAGPE